jgi:hypothetical protein
MLAFLGFHWQQHSQILTLVFLLKAIFFERELIKTEKLAISASS